MESRRKYYGTVRVLPTENVPTPARDGQDRPTTPPRANPHPPRVDAACTFLVQKGHDKTKGLPTVMKSHRREDHFALSTAVVTRTRVVAVPLVVPIDSA